MNLDLPADLVIIDERLSSNSIRLAPGMQVNNIPIRDYNVIRINRSRDSGNFVPGFPQIKLKFPEKPGK